MKAKLLLCAAITAMMCLTGCGASSVDTEDSTATEESEEAEKLPLEIGKLEYKEDSSYTDTTYYKYFITITNPNKDYAMADYYQTAKIKDSDNVVIGTVDVYGPVIPPDTSIAYPVYINGVSPSEMLIDDTYDVTFKSNNDATYIPAEDYGESSFDVSNISIEKDEYNNSRVTGQVTNNTSFDEISPTILAEYYKDGQLIYIDEIGGPELDKGETGNFEGFVFPIEYDDVKVVAYMSYYPEK